MAQQIGAASVPERVGAAPDDSAEKDVLRDEACALCAQPAAHVCRPSSDRCRAFCAGGCPPGAAAEAGDVPHEAKSRPFVLLSPGQGYPRRSAPAGGSDSAAHSLLVCSALEETSRLGDTVRRLQDQVKDMEQDARRRAEVQRAQEAVATRQSASADASASLEGVTTDMLALKASCPPHSRIAEACTGSLS